MYPAPFEYLRPSTLDEAIALLKTHGEDAKVLAGGPYEPEYPVPEGVSCHVTLSGATGDPFFQIDKAKRERKDAVNDLLNAL